MNCKKAKAIRRTMRIDLKKIKEEQVMGFTHTLKVKFITLIGGQKSFLLDKKAVLEALKNGFKEEDVGTQEITRFTIYNKTRAAYRSAKKMLGSVTIKQIQGARV